MVAEAQGDMSQCPSYPAGFRIKRALRKLNATDTFFIYIKIPRSNDWKQKAKEPGLRNETCVMEGRKLY